MTDAKVAAWREVMDKVSLDRRFLGPELEGRFRFAAGREQEEETLASEDDPYVAVVHADGNAVGRFIDQLLAAAAERDEPAEVFRRFSDALGRATREAAKEAVREVLVRDLQAGAKPQPSPSEGEGGPGDGRNVRPHVIPRRLMLDSPRIGEIHSQENRDMKTIVNKTHDPLRVPLPHGKTLHLGPNKTGQISVHDADHPPLVKMVEAGKVEIHDQQGNEAIPSVSQEGAPHVHAWGDKSKVPSFPTKTADGG